MEEPELKRQKIDHDETINAIRLKLDESEGNSFESFKELISYVPEVFSINQSLCEKYLKTPNAKKVLPSEELLYDLIKKIGSAVVVDPIELRLSLINLIGNDALQIFNSILKAHHNFDVRFQIVNVLNDILEEELEDLEDTENQEQTETSPLLAFRLSMIKNEIHLSILETATCLSDREKASENDLEKEVVYANSSELLSLCLVTLSNLIDQYFGGIKVFEELAKASQINAYMCKLIQVQLSGEVSTTSQNAMEYFAKMFSVASLQGESALVESYVKTLDDCCQETFAESLLESLSTIKIPQNKPDSKSSNQEFFENLFLILMSAIENSAVFKKGFNGGEGIDLILLMLENYFTKDNYVYENIFDSHNYQSCIKWIMEKSFVLLNELLVDESPEVYAQLVRKDIVKYLFKPLLYTGDDLLIKKLYSFSTKSPEKRTFLDVYLSLLTNFMSELEVDSTERIRFVDKFVNWSSESKKYSMTGFKKLFHIRQHFFKKMKKIWNNVDFDTTDPKDYIGEQDYLEKIQMGLDLIVKIDTITLFLSLENEDVHLSIQKVLSKHNITQDSMTFYIRCFIAEISSVNPSGPDAQLAKSMSNLLENL